MKVKLTENQLQKCILVELASVIGHEENHYNPIADGNAVRNPYTKQIEANKKLLQRFLTTNGRVMVNIDNGRDYLVFEIGQLASLMGKRFCMCQLMKDNKPFGAIYTKPFSLFKEKIK